MRHITDLHIEISNYKVMNLDWRNILFNFVVHNFVRTLHSTYQQVRKISQSTFKVHYEFFFYFVTSNIYY